MSQEFFEKVCHLSQIMHLDNWKKNSLSDTTNCKISFSFLKALNVLSVSFLWVFSVSFLLRFLKFFFQLESPHYCFQRSSHQRCSVTTGVLRNFAKFTGKQLCQRLFFNKVAGLRSATLLKMSLWHRRFLVNFVKFLRTPLSTEHLRWLLLFS